jgi:hypothetical protein
MFHNEWPDWLDEAAKQVLDYDARTPDAALWEIWLIVGVAMFLPVLALIVAGLL